MFIIALLALLIALAALLLLLRPPPPPLPPLPDPPPDPPSVQLPDPQSPPPPTRHVSFSLASSATSHSLSVSPSVSHRRWSSPFHKRKHPAPDSPCTPQPCTAQNASVLVDQFGRLPSSSRPTSSDTHPSPKPPRRLFTPPRLSLPGRWRSSSVSSTFTQTPLDQVDTSPPSPPPSTSTSLPSPPLQRTRFVNPFKKHSRSRTLSPPSTFKFPDTSSSSLSPPPQGRRGLVNKFKTVFKSISPEPSPIILSKPIVKTVNTRLRRKPVARTQPYGPPWNATMPVPDFSLSQNSLQKHAETMSQTSQKCFVHESPLPENTLMLPGQISPCTFIEELDEKLSLLQQQRIQDLVPSLHE